MEAPKDKYYLTYLTFLIHGIGILMPWNMFITAIGYFTQHKLSPSYIGYDFPYLPKFMQYLTFCSQIPALILSWLNIFVRIKGPLTIRIVCSIGVVIVVFIFTIFMAMLDTSGAPQFFFWQTMLCVVIMNSANGVYQNSIFGIVAKLPGKYTAAVILGNNISGTFASLVSLISKLSTPNLKLAAIWYFIMALFVLLLCFDTYFALPLNKYYRFFDEHEKQVEQQGKSSNNERETPPYWQITKQAFPQLANVFLVFFVTLAVFPALQAGIQKSSENFFVSDRVYVDVMCFLTFNLFAMIGSWLPTYIIWPGPKKLWIPVVVRLIYIPLFLFCNYQVEGVTRKLPVLFKNDYVYFLIGSTMAITSGYLSSLAMMYAPGTVEERYAQTAAMIAAAALLSGIFLGIIFAFIWPEMILIG
uniref:Equilibrative nucleoside transporter 1-like isoform X1 n=1 Tax=Diabrotica virgifera virgifera TaxID=50390 RepID=A0A6P7F4T6_DIAVI